MKKIILCISTLLLMTICVAQSENEITVLLNSSIEQYLLSTQESVKKGILEESYLSKPVFFTDNFPPDFTFSPNILEEFPVVFFDPSDYKTSELRKGIRLFLVRPLRLQADTLQIVITTVSMVVHRRKRKIGRGSFMAFKYEYNCNTHQWTLIDTTEGE